MYTIHCVSLHSLAWISWTCQGDLKYSASRLRRNQEERWIQWMIQYPTQTKQTKYLKLSVFRQYNYKYRKCVLNIKFEWSIISRHKTILAVQRRCKIQCRALLWASAKALCLCKSAKSVVHLLQHELKSLVMKLLELEKNSKVDTWISIIWVKMYQAKDFCLIRYKVLSMF